MKLEPTHDGTAIEHGDGVWRLKDLLTSDALQREALRVRKATALDDGRLELTFHSGEMRRVAVPGAGEAPRPLVIRDAAQVLTMDDTGVGLRASCTIVCEGGRIAALSVEDGDDLVDALQEPQIIDGRGFVVTPGLVDPHTHPVFAGERSKEFGLKAEGASYLEIHAAGGGIHSTVAATRAASFEALAERCRQNLDGLLGWGVTTCEGKSGYALDVEGELRLLRVLRALHNSHPVDVVPTLLGAHTFPKEVHRASYVQTVAEEMVPRAAQEGLALFCDAYCEQGAFRPDEVSQIFDAARQAGLGLRLHAEQFTDQGGAALAARHRAASADHLEAISSEGIVALAAAGTTAILLPGAALSCRAPWPPAAALFEAGVSVALGTDLNPGTSMTSALPLMMSLACMQMGFSCERAWRAVTIEAARSLGREDIGRIAPGCAADLALFAVPDYRYVPYHYGENHLALLIKGGRVVLQRSSRAT